MTKKYTTKTAALKATTADIRKLNINGNPFSKVVSDNVPETPTENDIWKYVATTDDKGVVTITDDITYDYTELTDAQKDILKTTVKVIDNKVLDANDQLLMNWDTKNFTSDEIMVQNDSENGIIKNNLFGIEINVNTGEISSAPIAEWNSDLSSLTNGMGMFYGCTSLTSFNGDLSSLTNGMGMFFCTSLTSFNGNLSKLIDGMSMFYKTSLTSFNGDLSSLTSGLQMFNDTSLTSFSGDLSNLINGRSMFSDTSLTSFSGDLSNLTNGEYMFSDTSLTSFNGDLSSLTTGEGMFYMTSLTSFNGDLSSLTTGYRMFGESSLKSFISNLSSLKSGYDMFDNCQLDEESIMLIADTINDISSLDKTVDSDWTYTTCDFDGNLTTETISSVRRGKLHLGYDATTITDTTNIFKYCNEIVDKGWTVYLNGSQYVSSDSDSAALIDGESSITPIPHHYKPIQVTDEKIAEYVDGNGNYYIIVGAQHVFGDDISTYGMFTSHQHAVSEITTGLGLTKYEKPSTKTINN